MDCSEAKPQLAALASGRVSADDEAELRAHLEACDTCSLEMDLLRGPSAPPAESLERDSEPAPESPLPPPPPTNSDWTVEKIFGDGGAPVPPAPGAADPAEAFATESAAEAFAAETSPVEPSPAPMLAKEATPPAPLGPAPSKAAPAPEAWDFEPADAARDATPPEESLIFAEQALNRRLDDPSRKGAARAIFWVGSVVGGLGLLGLSIWMAMNAQEGPPREIAARAKNPAAPIGRPATPEAVPAVPEQESAPAPEAGLSEETVSSDSHSPAPGAATTLVPAPPAAPPATGGATSPIKSGMAPKSAPSASANNSSGTKPGASKSVAPTTAKSADLASAAAPVKSGTTPPAAKAPPAADRTAPAAPTAGANRDDDDMWPTDDPVHRPPASPKTDSTPKKAAGTAAPRSDAPAPATAAEIPVPKTTTAEPSRADTTAAAPAGSSATLKPIDQLHADTEQAAKDQDLVALRRLKTAWKNLVRTVVGPNRSRAKRELADCLWDIQALSGRDSDQRETLLAYRDYLLSAPAGGADARSASRLRELEDALSERR